jgi:hypothetical protein
MPLAPCCAPVYREKVSSADLHAPYAAFGGGGGARRAGGDIDDRSSTVAGEHGRDSVPRTPDRRHDGDVERLPPGFVAGGGRAGVGAHLQRGVVVQHVQTPERVERGPHQTLDAVLGGDVGVQRHRLVAQFAGQDLQGFVVDVAQHHSRSVANQQASRRRTDATRSTGDDGHLSVQPLRHCCSPLS